MSMALVSTRATRPFDHADEVAEPGPCVGGTVVPAAGGFEERLVVGVRRLGDRLFEAHVVSDRVSMLDEHGVGEYASHASVAILKGVNDEKVEDEQSGQKHWMVVIRSHCVPVALDEVIDGKGRARGGHRLEANCRRSVWRAVHDQVVLSLERSTGHGRMSEEQPVQVQEQASVQRTPILLE